MSAFDENGKYIKTLWQTGDIVSADNLNKIEEALTTLNDNDISRHNESIEQIDSVKEASLSISVKEFGAVGDGVTVDYEAIQAALNVALEAHNNIIVCVPAGIYIINKPLAIFSNTHLLLDKDAVIRRQKNGNLLNNGVHGGTEQHSNITIEGGIWDLDNGHTSYSGGCHFTIAGAKDIHIKDVRFLNSHGNHAIDAGGVDNLCIENCSFEGFWINPSGERDFVEAIQISEFSEEGIPIFSGGHTNASTSNVYINNCVFTNNSENEKYSYWPCGVGHHSGGLVENEFNRDITIANCKFYGCTYVAVHPISYENMLVDNCIFDSCVEGVHITNIGKNESTYFSGSKPSKKIRVINSIFKNSTKASIWCLGKIAEGDGITSDRSLAYARDITVSNCIFENDTTSLASVYCGLTKGLIVRDCMFENCTKDIWLRAAEDAVISGNISNGCESEFLYTNLYTTTDSVELYSYNVAIKNNIINDTGKNGIFINNVNSFNASDNICKNCCSLEDGADRGGITVATNSSKGCVSGNVIEGTQHAWDIGVTVTCSNVIVSPYNVCDVINDKGVK